MMGEAKRKSKFTYIFTGSVYPDNFPLFSETTKPFKFSHPESLMEGMISWSIAFNRVNVVFVSRHLLSDLATAKNIITESLSALAAIAGLIDVVKSEVEINQVYIVETGKTIHFPPGFPGIKNENDKFDLQVMVDAVNRNIWLQIALVDFGNAIKYPKDTGFYCRRSIESLFQYIKK